MALTGEPNATHPIIEVFIGGWQNSKSVIRSNETKPEVAEADTPGILSPNEFRGFWIRVTGSVSNFVEYFLSKHKYITYGIISLGCNRWT